MKKLLLIILFIFISISLYSLNFKWKVLENDEFIFVFPEEVSIHLSEIIKIADEVYDEYKEIYSYKPENKIIVQISPFEDSPNGFGLPTGRIYISLLPLNYQYRLDKDWIRMVISHELGHVFQLGYIQDNLKWIQKYISAYFTINALEPIWLIEGYAQLSSYLVDYDFYDHRRASYFLDQIIKKDPFNEGEIISGKSSIGGESYYNFGFSFILFLYNEYGLDKLIDLNKYKGSLNVFFGLDNALMKIYGKNFKELKKEYIRLNKNQKNSYEYEFNGEIIKAQKEYNGEVYYLKYNYNKENYSIYKEGESILFSPYRIEDFAVIGEEIYLILMHSENDLGTTYLYKYSDNSLKGTNFKHLLSLESDVENIYGIMNLDGITNVVRIDPNKFDYELLYSNKNESIFESSPQMNGNLLAMRVNISGELFLYIMDTETLLMKKYFVGNDFSLGYFERSKILMNVYVNGYEYLGFFDIEKALFSAEFEFYKYGYDPLLDNSFLSELNGLRKIYLSEVSTFVLHFEQLKTNNECLVENNYNLDLKHRDLSFLYDWRYVGLYPYKNLIGIGYEDYLMKSSISSGVYYEEDKLKAGLTLDLNEYFPFDLDFEVTTDFDEFYISSDISKRFYIDALKTVDVGLRYDFPDFIKLSINSNIRKINLDEINNLGDFSYGIDFGYKGREMALALQYEYENYIWESNFNFSTSIFGRYAFGKYKILPAKFNNISIETKSANGFSVLLEQNLFKIDKSLGDFVYFGEMGYGMQNTMVLSGENEAASLNNSTDIFLKTIIYPYKTYPVDLSVGITIYNGKISPFFKFYF